jgi:hypothetical protein
MATVDRVYVLQCGRIAEADAGQAASHLGRIEKAYLEGVAAQ